MRETRARSGVEPDERPLVGSTRRQRIAWEALFAVAALALTLPLWVASYLPLQDFPQHVAAVRVIHDLDSPGFALRDYFELDWSRTQYISVYLVAHWLSYGFGVLLACKLLVAMILVATPYSVRSLLKAHSHPESYALLALPLAYNAHFVLGFLNFLAAIPLFFWGVSAAIRYRERRTLQHAVWVGVLALVLFYTHVIPYVMLAGAVLGLSLERSLRRAAVALLPLLPSLAALLFWLVKSPAGQVVLGGTSRSGGRKPVFLSIEDNLRELPRWLLDVVPGTLDATVLVVWVSTFIATLVVGNPLHSARSADILRRWAWLLPAVALAYFFAPAAYDWIWPINGRFPILVLLLAIVLIPHLPKIPKIALAVAALAMQSASVVTLTRAFAATERESKGLQSIVAQIPEGERVAGLIYERGSSALTFSPFLHAVAWYQAERGGAVMFSFTDFPQSPVRFRENNRPPRVPPRWEYSPERVRTESDLTWYRYVISRGGPEGFPGLTFVARAGSWRLWSTTP